MTELDQARLAGIAEATIAKGGQLAIFPTTDGGWAIEWWTPTLACTVWTQEPHRTVSDALKECATRLGVERPTGAAAA